MEPWRRRLIVVEDEALVAALLVQALQTAGFEATACASAHEARTLVEEVDPDGALIDIHLGEGPSGLHLGHILQRSHPHIGLVFLTKFHDPRLATESGWTVPEGSAFLAKDRVTDTALLTRAIESVLGQSGALPRDDRTPGALDVLTPTQLEILRMAAQGLTNTAIARQRGTSERTVEQRLQSVYYALGIPTSADVNPRVQAARIYITEAGMPGTPDVAS